MSDRREGSEIGNASQHPDASEPTDRPYVALSEALTWIAFRNALGEDELRSAVAGKLVTDHRSNDERVSDFLSPNVEEPPGFSPQGSGPFTDREDGLRRLEQAWEDLRAKVDSEELQIRGRYTRTYSLSEAQLAEPDYLTGTKIVAFSQFDVSTGGIRRRPSGQPAVTWEGHPQNHEREWESITGETEARDGYLVVEVHRNDLMLADPAQGRRVGNSNDNNVRGRLPPHATKNDQDHEEAAHNAAKIVRRDRCSVAQGIRDARASVDHRTRTEASVETAIRHAYNLMYDLHGHPKV